MEINFAEFFGTLAGFSAGVVVLTQFINTLFKVQKSGWKQAISWITAIVACVVGFLIHAGMFADYGALNEWQGWVKTIITGLAAGLISNGIYDIEPVRIIVEWIFSFIKKKPEVINE